MKKYILDLKSWASLCAMVVLLAACGQGSSDSGGTASTGDMPVSLSFRLPKAEKASLQGKVAVSNVDSLDIVVTGPGMAEITNNFSVAPGENVTHTLDIPVGQARVFAVTIFDPSGNAIYEGKSVPTDVLPPDAVQVVINLNPVRLDLPSELPKLSQNYLLRDSIGMPSFVEPASSTDYVSAVGIPNSKAVIGTSENYSLR